MIILLDVKFKESHAIIKLQMMSIKSREKTTCIVRASDKVQENCNCVGCFFFGKMEMKI